MGSGLLAMLKYVTPHFSSFSLCYKTSAAGSKTVQSTSEHSAHELLSYMYIITHCIKTIQLMTGMHTTVVYCDFTSSDTVAVVVSAKAP